jgi:hypothetical protein
MGRRIAQSVHAPLRAESDDEYPLWTVLATRLGLHVLQFNCFQNKSDCEMQADGERRLLYQVGESFNLQQKRRWKTPARPKKIVLKDQDATQPMSFATALDLIDNSAVYALFEPCAVVGVGED